jgi:hypothetical protein
MTENAHIFSDLAIKDPFKSLIEIIVDIYLFKYLSFKINDVMV